MISELNNVSWEFKEQKRGEILEMRNANNKKKLKALVVAFLLLFSLGAAFAFAPGQLSIGGAVSLDPEALYVQWRAVDISSTSGVVNNEFSINDARDRNFQHIEWDVTFETPGSATLVFDAHNHSSNFNALIGVLTTSPGALEVNDFGLTFSGTYPEFAGTIIPMNTDSPTYDITVTWDGTVPIGFDPSANPAFTFELSYDYTAIIP